MSIDDAFAWIEQARSDARTAEFVRGGHRRLPGDVGCHVALLCAQSFEKCIKGCMFLVGQTPTLTHGIDARIDSILREADTRSSGDARRRLRTAFSARAVRGAIRVLLAWTPGAARADEPNYEYPWRRDHAAELEIPCGHALFGDVDDHEEWARIARELSEEAAKILDTVRRRP